MSTAVEQPPVQQEQPKEAVDGAAEAAGRIQALDFSAPTKFTTELRRRIGRVLAPFCKALSTRMGADLRAPVEIRHVEARQLSWTQARASLPEESLLIAVEVRPIGRQMLLCMPMPLMLRALDCLLGGSAAFAPHTRKDGSAEFAPQTRKLSEIDWALCRRLVDSVVLQLSLVWRDLGGLELSAGEIETDGDAGLIVPIGEPTFAIGFEWEIAGLQSTFTLLVPWAAVEPVASEILSNGSLAHDAHPSEAGAVHRGLAAAKVLLRAEIGASTIPVEQVWALEQGSMLRLSTRAEQGVTLLARSVPLARGLPGRSGVRRAIKLTTPIEPEAETSIRPALGSHAPSRLPSAADRHAMREGLARLRDVEVRVWAELGRTHMPLGEALRLPQGSVVDLDQGAEDPIELYINGLPFASGTLAVTPEGDWAIQVGALL